MVNNFPSSRPINHGVQSQATQISPDACNAEIKEYYITDSPDRQRITQALRVASQKHLHIRLAVENATLSRSRRFVEQDTHTHAAIERFEKTRESPRLSSLPNRKPLIANPVCILLG